MQLHPVVGILLSISARVQCTVCDLTIYLYSMRQVSSATTNLARVFTVLHTPVAMSALRPTVQDGEHARLMTLQFIERVRGPPKGYSTADRFGLKASILRFLHCAAKGQQKVPACVRACVRVPHHPVRPSRYAPFAWTLRSVERRRVPMVGGRRRISASQQGPVAIDGSSAQRQNAWTRRRPRCVAVDREAGPVTARCTNKRRAVYGTFRWQQDAAAPVV